AGRCGDAVERVAQSARRSGQHHHHASICALEGNACVAQGTRQQTRRTGTQDREPRHQHPDLVRSHSPFDHATRKTGPRNRLSRQGRQRALSCEKEVAMRDAMTDFEKNDFGPEATKASFILKTGWLVTSELSGW